MAPPSQPGAQISAPAQAQSMNAVPSPLEFRIHEMNRRLYIFNSSGVSILASQLAKSFS